MLGLLEVLNLFPNQKFWRFGHKPHHNDKCSILCSLVLIIAIGGMLTLRLIAIFQEQIQGYTSQTIIDQSPPSTIITTNQNTLEQPPFMFAIDYLSSNPHLLPTSTLNISAYTHHMTSSSGNMLVQNISIGLEMCTSQHFSHFPQIQQKFDLWAATNWLCLPLNHNFTLEGSHNLNKNYSSINILFNCSGTCMNTFKSLNMQLYTLSSVINPTNKQQPQQYFLEESTLSMSRNTFSQYSYNLGENVVNTDRSIWPWAQEDTSRTIKAEEFKMSKRDQDLVNQSSSLIEFQRSTKTFIHARTYKKIIDAISFIGGVFNAFIGSFFFLLLLGQLLFQFKFASKVFKSSHLKKFNFKNLISQIFYKLLTKINCKPDWQQEEKRQKIQRVVNNLLDIVYLQKRISFLQRALSMVLDEHQLTGLHLIHGTTIQEAEDGYKKHQLRDRLISFFKLKQKESKPSDSASVSVNSSKKNIDDGYPQLKPDELFKWSLVDEVHMKQLKNMTNPKKQEQPVKSILRKQKNKRKTSILASIPNRNSVNALPSENRMNEPQLDVTFMAKQIMRTKCNEEEQFETDINFNKKNVIASFDMLKQETQPVILDDMVGEIDDDQLYLELEDDLKRLMDEAQDPRGSKVSKKIFFQLEDWFKLRIKRLVKKKFQTNNRVQGDFP